MTTLTGRRALVSGGSRGIGAEIVRRLAADGATVAFTYGTSRTEADDVVAQVAAAGGHAIAIQADSADHQQVTTSVDDALTQLGGLDILVNNAAVIHIDSAESFPLDQFDRMVAINVKAVFVAIQRVIPYLGDGGRIISISSANVERVPGPGLSVYAMTKGAIASMTKALARELGPHGITVNSIQSGPVATEMNPDEGDIAEFVRPLTAVGRYGRTSELASAVAYLATREAAFITGSNWNVDGGFTA